jgi:hypothetical protein
MVPPSRIGSVLRGSDDLLESGSLLLKRYKVIRNPRISENENSQTISNGTYWGHKGVSIVGRPFAEPDSRWAVCLWRPTHK